MTSQRVYASARKGAEDRLYGNRWHVYNEMPATCAFGNVQVSKKAIEQADRIFDQVIAVQTALGRYKQDEKRQGFRRLYVSASKAAHERGCLIVQRNKRHQDFSKIRMQLLEAAVAAGLFRDVRSPPGSPKASRIVPTKRFRHFTEGHPEDLEKDLEQLVILRKRDEKRTEMDITAQLADRDHVAAKTQKALKRINRVNRGFEITYLPCDDTEEEIEYRTLRPVLVAIFTDDFDHHGRLYSGKYGHQALSKRERASILFDGERSVELDYSAMHPRMLYHLEKIAFHGDPYALWDEKTTKGLRLMAKKVINAAINAKAKENATDKEKNKKARAVSACNRLLAHGTDDSVKYWKGILDAAGMTFADVYDLATEYHSPIAKYFGTDAGMRLMNLDGRIALAISEHFARRGLPCLPCHDSFVVPQTFEAELKRVMRRAYEKVIGFAPVIKSPRTVA